MDRIPRLKADVEVLQSELGEITDKIEELNEEHRSTYKELLEKKDLILTILIDNSDSSI